MKDKKSYYQHKQPVIRNVLIDPITKRFSPQTFTSDPIPEDHIKMMLEAARLAPSARNLQPWFFYYAHKDSDGYKKLLKGIPDMNLWCMKAPLLILATYEENSSDGNFNEWAKYDLGAACMSLVLQAQAIGYYSRQIGLFDADIVTNELNLSSSKKPCVIIAVGKIATEADLRKIDEKYLEKEKKAWNRKEVIAERLD